MLRTELCLFHISICRCYAIISNLNVNMFGMTNTLIRIGQSFSGHADCRSNVLHSMGVLIVMYLKILIESIECLKYHTFYFISNYRLVGGGVDDMFLFSNNVTAAIFVCRNVCTPFSVSRHWTSNRFQWELISTWHTWNRRKRYASLFTISFSEEIYF